MITTYWIKRIKTLTIMFLGFVLSVAKDGCEAVLCWSVSVTWDYPLHPVCIVGLLHNCPCPPARDLRWPYIRSCWKINSRAYHNSLIHCSDVKPYRNISFCGFDSFSSPRLPLRYVKKQFGPNWRIPQFPDNYRNYTCRLFRDCYWCNHASCKM